jgi:hypothetical protein
MGGQKNGFPSISRQQGRIGQFQFVPKNTGTKQASSGARSYRYDFFVQWASPVGKISRFGFPLFAQHHHKIAASPTIQDASGQIELPLKGIAYGAITRFAAMQITGILVACAFKRLKVLPFLGKNEPRQQQESQCYNPVENIIRSNHTNQALLSLICKIAQRQMLSN